MARTRRAALTHEYRTALAALPDHGAVDTPEWQAYYRAVKALRTAGYDARGFVVVRVLAADDGSVTHGH